MLGAFYASATMYFCSGHADFDQYELFYSVMKVLDMVIGQFLVVLFGWNFYVMVTGYTHIEFKSLMET